MSAPELQKTFKVSVALMVSLAIASFTLGGIVTGVLGLDSKIVDEVGGLRSDWERENALLREEIKRVEDKITRKVQNHELIHHPKK